MDVRMYVDGFNLYYGVRKAAKAAASAGDPVPSWKWVDFHALGRRMIASHWADGDLVGVDYCTARISQRPGTDPRALQRQQAFLRAVDETGVNIHLGLFMKKTPWRPLVRDITKFEQFYDVEEKGSDVNLATRLLVDGFQGRYLGAVVLSNDSDLEMPVRVVRQTLGLPVGILNPHQIRSKKLSPASIRPPDFYQPVGLADLAACQMPDEITDSHGRRIHKPPGW